LSRKGKEERGGTRKNEATFGEATESRKRKRAVSEEERDNHQQAFQALPEEGSVVATRLTKGKSSSFQRPGRWSYFYPLGY
jgi:hypothetical protein